LNLPKHPWMLSCAASNVQFIATKLHIAALHLVEVLAILCIERNFIR
jgi:hypothetical protein